MKAGIKMEKNVIQEYQKPLPRMRTAKECFNMIHEADPDSRISLTYIRNLAKNRLVIAHKIGSRILINYDSLIEYLNNPATFETRPAPERRAVAGIFPVQ